MKQLRNTIEIICLCIGTCIMCGLIGLTVFVQMFPYDETEHKCYEIVKERAENRAKMIQAWQKESMNKND